jgi:hypothetical protein
MYGLLNATTTISTDDDTHPALLVVGSITIDGMKVDMTRLA